MGSAFRVQGSDAKFCRPEPGTPNPEPFARSGQPLPLALPAQPMEAEVVRDSLLSVAGELDPRIGGPEIDQHRG